MTQLSDRMQALARRFAALAPQEQKALQGRMREQGLSFDLLPIPAREDDQPVQASFAQQRLWLLWQLDPQSSAYNQPALLRVRGQFDRERLAQSLRALVARHEVLRTNFRQDEQRVLQVIHGLRDVEVDEQDLRQANAQQLQDVIAERSARPFDLERDLLLRASLLRTGEAEWVLVFCTHHIVTDAWSMPILVNEVLSHYQAQADVTPLAIQYADHARWQRLWLEAGEAERQLGYWRERLGTADDELELPFDHPRPARRGQQGARVAVALPDGLGASLRRVAAEHGCTPFMVLLASLQVLLFRYSGSQVVRVGTPVANRTRAEVEALIGFFVNTQVLQVELDGRQPFSAVLAQVRQRVMEAQANQDLPFEHLVDALQPQRSLDRTPLFQVLFNHQASRGEAVSWQLPGVELAPLELTREFARFDLTLSTEEQGDQLKASWLYACDLFEAATIERLGLHWARLLEQALAEPGQAIEALRLEAPAAPVQAEPASVASTWLHQRFAAQAAAHPERLALVDGPRSLSYAALDACANHLAARLIARGVTPRSLVALSAERRLETLVGLLAVLKAGACYVALDPQFPRERLGQMLEDSGAQLVLAPSDQFERFSGFEGVATCLLDDALQAPECAEAAPAIEVFGDDLAYVIFTSGSTGRPKAVGVGHGALANYLDGIEQRLPLADVRSMALVSTLAADLGHTVLFGALAAGRTLHLVDADTAVDGQAFAAYMSAHAVDALKIVPSHLGALLAGDNAAVLPHRCLVLGGEASPPALLQRIRALAPQCRLANHYGPTETTVGAFTCQLDDVQAVPPLGAPLPNLRAHVLDAALNAAPVGGQGELYIGGAGLARGYLGQPGLTAERFVPDPFGAAGQRLYRTGDRVRQHADGALRYQGRADQQLKIRGYRVEPGEIERQLLAHPAVGECVVLGQPGANGLQLVAYVVAKGAEVVTADALKAFLRERVSAHQVPAHVLTLAALPLTANGKLDRRALPLPAPNAAKDAGQAPRDALQAGLLAVWQQVLGREDIGVDDNFFELGGDSIIAIQMVSRARKAGLNLAARDVFAHQTIATLALVTREQAQQAIDQGPVQGEVPLTPIQQGFFEGRIPQQHHWNQAVLLQPERRLEAQWLEGALQRLVRHHDALRLRFAAEGEGWRQWHGPLDEQPLLWQRDVADDEQLRACCEQAQASLDLGEGPLLRAVLATQADGTQRLLLVIHHLVVDGVSWRILLEDLQQIYTALALGREPELPAKTSAWRDWATRLANHAASEAIEGELAGWLARLQGADATLPCDDPAGSLEQRHAQVVNGQLPQARTRELLQAAGSAYRTQINDLLLAALAQAVNRWSGRPDVLVRLEGHGREDLFEDIDLSRTVGWFTSLYPVRLTPHLAPGDCIKAVKEQLRAIPGNGLGFGLLRHLASPEQRQALAALPVPRITFNYLGQLDQGFDADAWLRPCAGPSGDTRAAAAPLGNWLTLNAQVYQGCLGLSWTFSGQMFARERIEQLNGLYLEALQGLIQHCCVDGGEGVTPSDFPLAGLAQAQLDALPVAPSAIADVLPLTPMQQGMLFHSLYQPAGSAYLNQMRLQVQGLDVERFVQAWQACVDRHDVLRASFHWQHGLEQPLQVVHKHLAVPRELHDWRGRDDLASALDALAASDLARAFELDQAPLLRLVVVRTGEDDWHLIQTTHHILLDGWSSSRLLGEVLQRYAGQGCTTPASSYRPYLGWLAKQPADASEAFWKARLAELAEPTRLADALADGSEREAAPGSFAERVSRLGVADTARLKAFARQQKVTANTVLQAAWLLLLRRYTQQDCVAFGATVSGRPAELPGIEEQLGLFINTLPVIAQPEAQLTVGQWLRQVQDLNLAMRDHEHTPLYEIQRWAGQGGGALFDHILIFENYPVSAALEQGAPAGLRFSDSSKRERTSYALTLSAGLEEDLVLQYSHACDVYGRAAIEQLDRHLQGLLRAFCEDDQRCLGSLGLLAAHEQAQVVEAWNATAVPFADDRCLHQLIEASAVRTPTAPALSVAGETLDYATLNRCANRLARRLRAAGVGPDVLVGIAVERGVELVVGLLAILKAGGAYVPMDPEYPAERLAHMVEDSGAQLVLTQAHLRGALALPAGVAALELQAGEDWLAEFDGDNLDNLAAPGNLAYVIYTSGSTGKPKGVGVRHDGVLNFLASMLKQPGIDASDRVLSLTSLSFDIAGLELYGSLLAGACIVLVERATARDPQALLAAIEAERVSVVQATPSTWRMLLDSPQAASLAGCKALCGGEALAPDLAARLIERCGHVWNLYGPTETTIWSALHYLDAGNPQVLLGRPLDNTALLVLDADLQPVPVGVAGELYIGGAGLARGYHQRPGLTAERFLASPFADGERIYRTGDLARFDGQGRLEYIGRADHQVKIRGFRIELGEIEAQLLARAEVREAAVVARDTGLGTQLVGYLVPADAALVEAGEAQQALRETLRAALGEALPEFMVPAQLMLLARMPLTPNGKLDRKALPAPDASLAQARYQAPRSELECQLAQIWAEVLKLEKVGLADNFFELGGHSLLATQATARAQQVLRASLPLDAMFRAKSLEDYAVCIAPHLNTDFEENLSDMHDFLTELELE